MFVFSIAKFIFNKEIAHKDVVLEGGLKLPPHKRHMLATLTPEVADKTIKLYEDLINRWNGYLISLGEEPVKPLKPTGSVSYYTADIARGRDDVYGDIDYLVEFPLEVEGSEAEITQARRRSDKKYTELFVNFLNSKSPDIVDVEETLRGRTPMMVMMRLPDDKLVQVDTIKTFPMYSGWMEGRYTPERGLKGYTIGNLYKSLGDYLVMSIGTEGVVVRSRMGQRVPSRFSRSKGVETSNISLDIRNFLRDIAHYVIGSEDIEEDPLLTRNPGVDPANVTIAGVASGIKGLAKTLGKYGVYNTDEMLREIYSNYADNVRKNVENKRNRGLEESYYQKLLKLNSHVIEIVGREFGI